DLERGILAIEAPYLRALDRQVFLRERFAQRRAQHLVALQGIERLAQRRRQSPDSAPATLVICQRVRIDQRWLARIALVLDAVETSGEEDAEREIRIAGGIRGLELEVGRLHLDPAPLRGHADGALAIVRAPRGVRARLEPRLEPAVGVHGRRRQ